MTVGVGQASGLSTAGAVPYVGSVTPLVTPLVLPPLTLPASSGAFRREGHGIENMPMFGDAKMQTGAARRRRIYLATPSIVTVSLEVTQTGVREFQEWFDGPMAAGTNFFSSQVANQGPGLLWFKARFHSDGSAGPYQVEFLGGIWWKITAKLITFGDGSTTGPASSILQGGVLFDLIGNAQLTALQPISGGVTFALLPVAATAGGVLSGGVAFALLVGTYLPPAPVGLAAGTSTANAASTYGFVGNAAGVGAATGVPINPSVGNAAGFGGAIASAITQGLTYPDEKGTWVSSSGPLTVGVNDIPIYFLRPRVLVGVSVVTLGGAGSCQLDVYKVPIGSYPPSAANSICAAAKPVISAARTYVDLTLTGWTKSFAAGDVAVLHVDATSTFTLIAIKLHFRET